MLGSSLIDITVNQVLSLFIPPQVEIYENSSNRLCLNYKLMHYKLWKKVLYKSTICDSLEGSELSTTKESSEFAYGK